MVGYGIKDEGTGFDSAMSAFDCWVCDVAAYRA